MLPAHASAHVHVHVYNPDQHPTSVLNRPIDALNIPTVYLNSILTGCIKRTLSPYFRNLPQLHITMTSFDMAIVEIHAVVSWKTIMYYVADNTRFGKKMVDRVKVGDNKIDL